MNRWIAGIAAVLTGIAVAAAFPPQEQSELAWVGFVPLLLVCMRVRPGAAFQWGGLAGAVFWLINLFWLTEVTWPGWVLLALYCALYTATFAALSAWLFRAWGVEKWSARISLLFVLPVLWAGLEFMRAIWLTGFAWNPLGGSQFERIMLIQMASWTGVYGVSALVMLLNMSVALTVQQYIQAGGRGRRAWHPEMMFGFLILALAFTGGQRSIKAAQREEVTALRTALIQPNIPQYQKWTDEFKSFILHELERLSRLAIQAGPLDLLVWPETAVPDYVRLDPNSSSLVQRLATNQVPLLVGTMDVEWDLEGRWRPMYFNSSLLYDAHGDVLMHYHKQHLVMFGEYVPLDRYLPFLSAMTPIDASFDAGRESTVFKVPKREETFAVLICFEDTVARLGRRAVRAGARMLVNQTNDAWFRESIAARQHMTHSVFRAVENRVPVVRAANTGISCGIDRFGRIHSVLAGEAGSTFVAGFQLVTSQVPREDMSLTVYTRYGDWFGWSGLGAVGIVVFAAWRRRQVEKS
jgi:apolipoprotein N-acyltransferase